MEQVPSGKSFHFHPGVFVVSGILELGLELRSTGSSEPTLQQPMMP